MNCSSFSRPFLFLTVLLSPLGSFAQSALNSTSVASMALNKIILARQTASTLVANRDFAGALAAISASNADPVGTAEYSLESGVGLIALLGDFRSKGDSVAAVQLAAMAQQQLAAAEALFNASTPAFEQANEQELRGIIAERYQGNRAAARKFYTKAVALAPGLGQAPSLLAYMDRVDAQLAKKGASSAQ